MDEYPLLSLWLIFCSCLVLIMQAGFTCFESGNVRNKNSINVALKNVSDFCVCAACYWVFGYALMFGDTLGGWIGSSGFLFSGSDNPLEPSYFLFQLMFCCTAATLISGAVAERMRFSGYILITLITASLVYPLFGHWAWADRLLNAPRVNPGWLQQLGFIDFAGASVVHSVGGWLALICVLIIGPRLGRFGPENQVHQIYGCNLPLTALGTFLLFLGWFGFNGGSLGRVDAGLSMVFINTALGGTFGGFVVLLICIWQRSLLSIRFVLNGVLAGLVGITACANIILPIHAAVIGGVAGALSYACTSLLERLRIDDVVGVVPVHLVGGIWGTLAVAIFADPSHFLDGRGHLAQLAVQAAGILACAFIAFIVPYPLIHMLNRFFPLRVSQRVEVMGLNFGEFGLRSEALDLAKQMRQQRHHLHTQHPVTVDVFSELGMIETEYNALLRSINRQVRQASKQEQALTKLARTDHLTGLDNRLGFDQEFIRLWQEASATQQSFCLLIIDIDYFKQYNDYYGHHAGDHCLQQVAATLSAQLSSCHCSCARIGGEEFGILCQATTQQAATSLAQQLCHAIAHCAWPHARSAAAPVLTISIGLACMPADGQEQSRQALYLQADQALYQAKQNGRNQVQVYRAGT